MSEPPVDQIPKTLEEAVDASDDPAARLEPGWRLLERARALGQQADDDPQRAKVAEYVGALGELAVEMAAGEGESSPSAMSFTLRPARDADWSIAWPIQRAAFLDLVTRTAGGWDEAQVRKCEAAWDAARTSIVEQGGQPVGWVRLERNADHDWLDLIVLDPGVQDAGLGTQVMRRLMDAAAARGVPLWLSVYRENRARVLYRRLGFRETPRDEVRVFMVWPADSGMAPPR